MNLLQKLCNKLTDHRWRKLTGYTQHSEACPPDCKTEYYWKCRVCGYSFWNYGGKK